MKATLNGQSVFGDQDLSIQAGSRHRSSLERTIPGLDGILSIDLGLRARKIKQAGILRAVSEAALREKIDTIGAYIDGDTYTLATNKGEQFDNVRMDSFKVTAKRFSGNMVSCNYEIIYVQLGS